MCRRMGTPRLSEPADQMRNVQRTASCGGASKHDEMRDSDCRSNEIQPGEVAVNVATAVALNSNPMLFAKGCDAGAVRLVEVAQHDLLAQQPGLHACCAGES